jgi:hypothetical protein
LSIRAQQERIERFNQELRKYPWEGCAFLSFELIVFNCQGISTVATKGKRVKPQHRFSSSINGIWHERERLVLLALPVGI